MTWVFPVLTRRSFELHAPARLLARPMTPSDARPWLFLTASTAFEVVWIVSLRMTDGFTRLAPLLVYAASGLGAAVCLSVAMKIIPMGTAYAFWMGASVVGVLHRGRGALQAALGSLPGHVRSADHRRDLRVAGRPGR